MGLASIVTIADVMPMAPLIADLDPANRNALLAAACVIADRYIGRDLASASDVEWYDGSKTIYLNLKRYPVTLMTELKFDRAGGRGQIPGTFGTDTILTLGTDYVLDYDRGIATIIRTPSGGDWFARGYTMPTMTGLYGRGLVAGYVPAQWGQIIDSIKVTYTAGLTVATADLFAALAQLMTYMYKVNNTGGLLSTSISFIDVSETIANTQALSKLRGGIPELATSRQILDGYRVPYTGGWIL